MKKEYRNRNEAVIIYAAMLYDRIKLTLFNFLHKKVPTM